ncbi:hypothetical protein ACWT_4153 [Actinoplanes sp. SE50]|uniref:hypothetical protein n=1 Tax=unclassified Actinoplanes TaxID=2626549 RepID=UPI00023EC0F6|nr:MULTISPECIES: hypothetical protein [unclassified Actinoplanes]AEV85173.1 hypothetical protein ACPL_4282 [Actinoplanes sp. SE50/110]ATO83568.1 hypothetical protein ACWT_4153 [Actinoplanes sp. SE50]SLM00975.1 hypothetical protein ACSP50_4208 [Actinoplanes sp. SE50/110]
MNIRKPFLGAALTTAVLAGTLGVSRAAQARAADWSTVAAPYFALVFDEYGGPTTIGHTQNEYVYAVCQQDGIWGWQTNAYVPSLSAYGWIRNGDLFGYTNPAEGLSVC